MFKVMFAFSSLVLTQTKCWPWKVMCVLALPLQDRGRCWNKSFEGDCAAAISRFPQGSVSTFCDVITSSSFTAETTLNRKPRLKVLYHCFTFMNCLSFIYVLISGLFKGCTGWQSAVGIVTRYRPDGPGFLYRWGRDFSHLFKLALWTTQPVGNSRRYNGRGVALTTHTI